MAIGDWDNLALSDSTLKGIAPVDLRDPEFGYYDTDAATAEYVAHAKDYIETRLVGSVPHLIVKADGPNEFMDAVTTITEVSGVVQRVLALAFLMHYYAQERFGASDLYDIKREEMKAEFEQAYNALVNYIQLDQDFIDAIEATADADLSQYNDQVYVG
jgi:hypothetical protein